MATLPSDVPQTSRIGSTRTKPTISASASSTESTARQVLSLPPKWLGVYDDFISKNANQVSQIESALRSLTYIIPGRFRDAEIASETVHSGVQLLSMYHDHLLQRAASTSSGSWSASPSPASSQHLPSAPPASPHRTIHARYTAFWSQKSSIYRRVALALQVVQYTQLLIEMAAKRRGDERLRWRVVVLVEAFKALCKLILLRITRSRPLVTPALPERVPIPPADEEELDSEDEEGNGEYTISAELRDDHGEEAGNGHTKENGMKGMNGDAQQNGHAVTPPDKGHITGPAAHNSSQNGKAIHTQAAHTKDWHMPRTQSTLPSLPSNSDIGSYLLSRVLTADDIKPAPKLLRPLAGTAQAAEVLHIIAPLVYALALAHFSSDRYNTGRRAAGGVGGSGSGTAKGTRSAVATWSPWLLGVALSLAARQLRDRGLRTTALEREEWNRRGWGLGWWAMRGAAYEGLMKGVVQGVRRRVPSFVGGILEDYEYLWENYYFSTVD